MAKKSERYMVKNLSGGWDVKKAGARRVSSHQDTRPPQRSGRGRGLGTWGGREVRGARH